MQIEEEAKKKWCPIRARINGLQDSVLMGAVETQIDLDNCIGSDCIKWRGITILSILKVIPYNDRDGAAIQRFIHKAKLMEKEGVFRTMGYCGAEYEK